VAFIKSTTDERVRFERAPFDHPEITVPNGHETDASIADGAHVTQWACDRGNHQVFNWSGNQLVARHSGKCIAVSRSLTTAGAGLVQWTCSGTGANGRFTRRAN
jgi:hypothetical protein